MKNFFKLLRSTKFTPSDIWSILSFLSFVALILIWIFYFKPEADERNTQEIENTFNNQYFSYYSFQENVLSKAQADCNLKYPILEEFDLNLDCSLSSQQKIDQLSFEEWQELKDKNMTNEAILNHVMSQEENYKNIQN